MVLEPGRAVTDAIAQTASDLKLGADYQARVRQTGRIPTDDDEFGTLKENAGLNAAVSAAMVIGLVMSSRFSSPTCTPVIPSDSALSVPRRLGSAAKVFSRALARVNPSVARATLSVGKYNKPFRAKKLPLGFDERNE